MPRAKLNDLVSSIVDSVDSYTLPKDLELVRTLVIDFALHIRSLEAELKHPHSHASSSSSPSGLGSIMLDTDADDVADSDGNDPDALAGRFEDLTIKRHYGSSSTYQFLKNALDVKGELTADHKPMLTFTKRPEFWETPQVDQFLV